MHTKTFFGCSRYSVPPESFGPVCVVVDKIDKLPESDVAQQLVKLGVQPDAVQGILSAIQVENMEGLEDLLGSESEAVRELKCLFALSEGYGYRDWLVLDATIVRGLAYYTGWISN